MKKVKEVHNQEFVYSICIFKNEDTPNFINSNVLKEVKFSYLLIVEHKNFIVINKKLISGLDKEIEHYIENIDYNTISKMFLSDSTNFEKMTMYNMDISNNVIRRKNVEANNLKESSSTLGSSKYMVNQLRLSNVGENKISLSLNLSKINQLGKKVNIDNYLIWVRDICIRIENFTDHHSYMDNFSLPLSFEENIDNHIPSGFLFLTSDILLMLENQKIHSVDFDGKNLNLQKFITRYQKTLEIKQDSSGNNIIYFIENKFDKTLRLKINKTSISLHSKILSKVIVTYDTGEKTTLLSLINKLNAFIISFDNAELIYWNKKLFKDSKLLGNIPHFLKIFRPYNRLSRINSEKGENSNYTKNFSNNSLFNFIEKNIASKSDYIICDDLGNEWADYISIKSHESITFYHAKNGKKGMSASKFHDVIAQAQKNLGNIYTNEFELLRKKESWDKVYLHNDYPNSQIRKLRKGISTRNAIDMYKKTLYSPNSKKEVYLVVNFISLSELRSELDKLKNGDKAKNETIQILWLISSFVLSCKELNIDAYITCLP